MRSNASVSERVALDQGVGTTAMVSRFARGNGEGTLEEPRAESPRLGVVSDIARQISRPIVVLRPTASLADLDEVDHLRGPCQRRPGITTARHDLGVWIRVVLVGSRPTSMSLGFDLFGAIPLDVGQKEGPSLGPTCRTESGSSLHPNSKKNPDVRDSPVMLLYINPN